MKILLCGATGFVGRHIRAALEANGHVVTPLRSRAANPGEAPNAVHLDFAAATTPEAWTAALVGIDAVVNAVGVLRNTTARPMIPIHDTAPRALFEACARAGVRRVVQISALGVDTNHTQYAVTKRAAEKALETLTAEGRLDGVILRPSVVFGRGGASTALFMQLARLPLLLLPAPALRALIQPIGVRELAEAVALLMGSQRRFTGIVPCVGARALSMADFIALIRQHQGSAPARLWPMPTWMSQLSARAGDLVPASPWCTETLTLMQLDNAAPPAPFAALLGRLPSGPGQLLKEY